MNKHLAQLIEIAKLDKEIDSFEPRLKEANAELNSAIEKKSELEKERDTVQEEVKNSDLKILKSESHIKELSAKLDDVAKKSGSVKTEKEAKALQLEEEIAKEQISFANSEIEKANKAKETRKAKLDEIKDKEKEIETGIKDIQKEVNSSVKAIESEQKEIYGAREKLIREMDQKIIEFYEKIRRWAANKTVVSLYKQACGGCFMKLNDKTYSDVIRAEEIITCPHCGRIVYAQVEEKQ